MKIETKRLIITEFDMSMAEAVHLNSLDEDNRRFVSDEVFETVEDAAETVEFLMSCYKSGKGPLVYPVLLKDGTYIGYVQEVPFDDGTWEVGYHIGENYTKQGYATEAVTAFLPVIMKQLGITEMTGICLADNFASVKVMEYGWYLCMDSDIIVSGMGVIENDFHDRKDLSPNVCAVYTEEEYRCKGVAGRLLNMVVNDLKDKGITPVYLITDHIGFYERYGWEFLCMVQGDGEPEMTRMYIHR